MQVILQNLEADEITWGKNSRQMSIKSIFEGWKKIVNFKRKWKRSKEIREVEWIVSLILRKEF